jgi:predicted transcriptional regulator
VKALASETAESIKLPEDVKERLDELRALSEKAEAGEKGARQELNQALLKSSPAVIARAADVGRKSQHLLIDTLAGGNPLAEQALSAQLDLMRADLAGEAPTPLEALLVERVVAAWLVHQLLEVLNSAQLWNGVSKEHRLEHSFLKFYVAWQERAHRQLLSTIKTLAQVRKLQSNAPSVQLNQQINVGR